MRKGQSIEFDDNQAISVKYHSRYYSDKGNTKDFLEPIEKNLMNKIKLK